MNGISFTLGIAALAIYGCGGDTISLTSGSGGSSGTSTSTMVCTPGQQVACACPGGTEGVQRCLDDGSKLGDCACTGTGGAGGSTTSAGATGGAETSSSSGTAGCPSGPDDDADKDGVTPAQGDCNDCDGAVGPAAVDFPDGVDNDCDGEIDNPLVCDDALAVDSKDGIDALRAIGLCNKAWTETAAYVQANGTAPPGPPQYPALITDYFHLGHGLLEGLGSYYTPREGKSMLALSTGVARPPSDPNWMGTLSKSYSSDEPKGESVCGATVLTGKCHDSIELLVTLRVPPNAHGFTFNHASMSKLLAGSCSQTDNVFRVVVGADLLVARCPNGEALTPSCSVLYNVASSALVGTGFDGYGGTPWLRTSVPADEDTEIKVSFAVWDSETGANDSTILIDRFEWSATPVVSVTTSVQP